MPAGDSKEENFDATPPRKLEIDTGKPTPKKAVNERLRLALILAVLLLLSGAIWKLYKFHQKRNVATQAQIKAGTASDAASSSRKQIQGNHGSHNDSHSSSPRSASEKYNDPNTATHPEVAHQAETSSTSTYNAPAGDNGASAWLQAQIEEEKQDYKDLENRRHAPIDQRKEEAAAPAPNTPPPQMPASSDPNALLAMLTPPAAATPAMPSAMPAALPAALAGFGDKTTQYRAQNDQEGKQHFTENDSHAGPRVDPPSPYMLMHGDHILASVIPTINSDLPGEVSAIVRQNVMDHVYGKFVLVPAGTKVVGYYNSNVTYGQQNVQVAWTRLIYPDGTSQTIGKQMAYGGDGSSGLHDKVDNHWARLLKGAALISVLSAGVQISQNHTNSSVLTYPNTGQEIGAALGNGMSQLGQNLTERNTNVQPTLKIRTGDDFFINVDQDIAFEGPYQAHAIRKDLLLNPLIPR
jgi:type IV secretion system protein TrbI